MNVKEILIIEDDKNIAELISYTFEKENFKCTNIYDGQEALNILNKNKKSYHLIILDIMLPKINGLEICKTIKTNKTISEIPIIMLTAKGEEIDRILGFELGADDYIVKPFSPRELLLRVKAILKRIDSSSKKQDILIKTNNINIDISRHQVSIKNKQIKLTSMEFNLLVLLIQRKGRVQSRERLLNDVWEKSSSLNTRTIDTHIKRLRKKLGNQGFLIETIRNIGYKFKED